MILDALTRAEHERQLENQPDLKFVTPVKPQKNNPNKTWLYVGLGVLANALILFFVIRAFSGDAENTADSEIEMAMNDATSTSTNIETISQVSPQQNLQPELQQTLQQPLAQELSLSTNTEALPEVQMQAQTNSLVESGQTDNRPLAMEASNEQAPEVDRPLLYESKQPSSKSVPAKSKATQKPAVELAKASGTSTKGNVSFSSTELSADDALPISNTPKLLIDQGNEVQNSAANTRVGSSAIPNVRDLPESTRANLNQYEVNVHVFDDNPTVIALPGMGQ